MDIYTIHKLIERVCPIDGISSFIENDETKYRIDFKEKVTIEEKLAALELLESFKEKAPENVYTLYKSNFIRRMTGPEATQFDTSLSEEAAYLRLLYNSVEYFKSDDALFQYLHNSLSFYFGEDRATELLLPEQNI